MTITFLLFHQFFLLDSEGFADGIEELWFWLTFI